MISLPRSYSNLLRRSGRGCSKSTTSSAGALNIIPPSVRPFRQLTLSSASNLAPLGFRAPRDIATYLTIRRFIHRHQETPTSKLCPDAKTALALSGLKTGDTVAVGGFGNGGIPETLLNALSSHIGGPSNLTVASLTAGVDSFGLGRLFEAGKVKRMISSYVGENKVSLAAELMIVFKLSTPANSFADGKIIQCNSCYFRTLSACFSVDNWR
jgi:hypothetical protein